MLDSEDADKIIFLNVGSFTQDTVSCLRIFDSWAAPLVNASIVANITEFMNSSWYKIVGLSPKWENG